MRSSWVIWVGHKSNNNCLCKRHRAGSPSLRYLGCSHWSATIPFATPVRGDQKQLAFALHISLQFTAHVHILPQGCVNYTWQTSCKVSHWPTTSVTNLSDCLGIQSDSAWDQRDYSVMNEVSTAPGSAGPYAHPRSPALAEAEIDSWGAAGTPA